MTQTAPPATDATAPDVRYCTNHPPRETLVSCGRCGRPFCTDCLLHTAAGQRCYECAGVRRDAAQRALATTVAKSAGIMMLGAAIGSMFGLMGLLVGAFAGGMAGQTLSPAVNRHTRSWMLPLAAICLTIGTWLGFALPTLARILLAAGGRPVPVAVWFAVPIALLGNWFFWVFVVIALALAYRQAR